MKQLFKKTFLAVAMASTLISCGDDEDPITIVASEIQASVDENVAQGTPITTVDASVNEGNLMYSISSQSIAGALAIDAQTGAITVAEQSAFDHETNPNITGKIALEAEGVQKLVDFTININDVDGVADLLSTSKTNYDNASNGSWVAITETEYNNLANNISDLTKSGISETDFQLSNADNYWTSSEALHVLTGTGVTKLPASSYVIAFKFIRNDAFSSENSQVKISEISATTGFTNLGGVLPTETGTTDEAHYYVLKGNFKGTTAAESHIGLWSKGRVLAASSRRIDDIGMNWAIGDSNTFNTTSTNSNETYYQSLSTTTMQW